MTTMMTNVDDDETMGRCGGGDEDYGGNGDEGGGSAPPCYIIKESYTLMKVICIIGLMTC